MLTVYTRISGVEKDKRLIQFVDLEFDKVIYNTKLNSIDLEFMKHIDNAEYIGNGLIKTIFGVTEIQNLSSGCKTLILLNHQDELGNCVINISECGQNALDFVFKMDNKKVLLTFKNRPYNYDVNKLVNVKKINSSKVTTLNELFCKGWK